MKIYTNPKDIFNTLMAIGEDAILLANPKESEVESVADKLQNGVEVTPRDTKAISFSTIKRVRYNEKHPVDLDISYRVGKDSKTASFSFSSTEERTEAFALMKSKLSGATEQRKELNAVTAALKPLLFALGFGGLTYVAFRAAQQMQEGVEAEISGRHGLIKRIFSWLLELLGPIGVLVVGGILVALCVVALIKRVGNPPVFVSLEAK